jgi:hypothetical protein
MSVKNIKKMIGISNTVKDISNVVKEMTPINTEKKE